MKPRVYHEHPAFDEFTRFDPERGVLTTIDQTEFWGTSSATRFEGALSPTHTRFPRRVYFQITRHCGLGCRYCFIRAGSGQPHAPTEAVLRMARFLGSQGLMEIRLTGGEPTTHPDFLAIFDAFRDSEVYVSVATNGVLARNLLDALAERRHLWLICSLDGGRDAHERSRPGTFDRICANLTYLKEKSPDTRLRLTAVLTRHNLDQIEELGRLAHRFDAESVTIIPLRPELRDRSILEEMPSASEFLQVLREIARVSNLLGVRMTTTIETEFASVIHRDPVVRKWRGCAAGREATNLDYDAQRGVFLVYGCAYSPAADLAAVPAIRTPFLAGELSPHEPDGLLELWQDERAWAVFRDEAFKSKECRDCHYREANQCVGSCPIQNVDWPGIQGQQDVVAELQRQLSMTGEWYCYKHLLGLS
jgi:radical SAM protein with 4Fe4S-binding SPASM domain